MGTLLNVGDIIRIREDIKEDEVYNMVLNTNEANNWVDEMLPAGTLVEITKVLHGQYRVREIIENDNKKTDSSLPEDFWTYTDTMFDPELLTILLEDKYKN